MSDLKKLGMDRGTTSTATSVKPVTNRPTVGDIASGSIVSVRIGNASGSSTTGQTKLKGRPTAAIPANNPSTQIIKYWYIEQNILYVVMNAAADSTLSFWVF